MSDGTNTTGGAMARPRSVEPTVAAETLGALSAEGRAVQAGSSDADERTFERLSAYAATAGRNDRGKIGEEPFEVAELFGLGVVVGAAAAVAEQLGERGAQLGQVAAAGAEEIQVFLHRPGDEGAGACERAFRE
jgi:hypothetical protein